MTAGLLSSVLRTSCAAAAPRHGLVFVEPACEGRAGRGLPARPGASGYESTWTTISEFPSGSRTQNMGGTGSP